MKEPAKKLKKPRTVVVKTEPTEKENLQKKR